MRPLHARCTRRGFVLGALALAVFFGLDFVGATLDFMGFSDEKATNRILHRYGAQIARDQLEILMTYVVIGALLGGLDQRMRDECQMPCTLTESPLTCVAVGSGRSLEEFEVIHRTNRTAKRRRRFANAT